MTQATDAREARVFASELKFLVDQGVGATIRSWARARLQPDPHGTGAYGDEYRTASVYFDTAGYDVFFRRGSFGRSKFRVRRYGCGDSVFLERKLARPGLVTKRRTLVAREALGRLERPEPDRQWSGDWFARRLQLRGLRPVCQVSYSRTAHVAAAERGPIRLTLDENVRALPAEHVAFTREGGTPVLEPQMILELKYSVRMPDLFQDLVETFALVPQSASKYRLSVVALGCVPSPETTAT